MIGIITQVVAVAVTFAPGFQTQNIDREENYERARKLEAIEFQGTTDPIKVGNWI